MKKILLVDDEKELSKAVCAILKMNGYDVTQAFNGQEALDMTRSDVYDCIVMDIMMPVMDGIESLGAMRRTGVNTPVILLTAKSQVEDKVEGLDGGANDYLTKPFDTKELLARIRALTRADDERKKKVKLGNLIYDKENNKIRSDTASLILNESEGKVMDILVNNLNRDILGAELNTRALDGEDQADMYISLIQEKIRALNGNMQINVSGGTYRLEMI